MRKLISLLCIWSFPLSVFAAFGDKPVNWSSSESVDFQDYVVRSLNRQNAIVQNYWAHYWLNQRFLKLNLASPAPVDATLPLILKDPTINAFAIPGNVIAIHTGLWRATDNESELVSVLAHEMSHIALDHFSRLTQKSNQQALTLATGILVSILLAQENPEAANAALISTFAGTAQSRLTFSRAMEVEADQLAQSIMTNTRYDTEAGRVFFQKLDDNASSAYEFLMTHPLGNTRSSKLSASTSTPSSNTDERLYLFLKAYVQGNRDVTELPLPTIQSDPANPDLHFAHAIKQISQESDTATHAQRLKAIIQTFPSFLPAHFELLNLQISHDSSAVCDTFNQLNSRVQKEFLTLNVIENMKRAAERCQHRAATYWHSQFLWQSGREAEAIAFLGRSLKNEKETNQAALLKTLLSQFTSRYERFN